MIASDVAFASFGPLNHSPCGANTGHGDFPMLKTVYNMFRGKICPPEGMIIAWSGQFVVSRRRILGNRYETYRELDEMIEAPEGHWLHNVSPITKEMIPSPAFLHLYPLPRFSPFITFVRF